MFPKLDGYSGRILIFIIVAVESGIFSSWGKKKKGGERGRISSSSHRSCK